MMKSNKLIIVLSSVLILASCAREKSSSTGWEYNNSKNGGFETNNKFQEQITGPGLLFVEGGSFTMGRVEQDVMYDWNNVPRKVTVSSFYLDETEVRNVDYLEYLHWIKRVYSQSYPEVYKKSLPDTLVWRDKLGYNEPFVTQYLRHPAYQNYPVVGVSWTQANDYCIWRTDRVNERILINEGILKEDPEQVDDNTFNTEAYLAGQYEGIIRRNLRNLDPSTGEKSRQVRMEDGLLLPKYRLATEAEWEFACKAGTDTAYSFGNDSEELSNHSWHLGNSRFKYQKVGQKSPNPFGLYDMHGNVWEWVLDQFVPPADTAPKGILQNPLVAPNTLYPRVVKGGSWDDGAVSHRSAGRMGSEEAWKQQDPQIPKSVWYHTDAIFVGFRVVRPREIPSLEDIEKYWPSEEDILAIPSR